MLPARIKESLRTAYSSLPIMEGSQERNGDTWDGKNPRKSREIDASDWHPLCRPDTLDKTAPVSSPWSSACARSRRG